MKRGFKTALLTLALMALAAVFAFGVDGYLRNERHRADTEKKLRRLIADTLPVEAVATSDILTIQAFIRRMAGMFPGYALVVKDHRGRYMAPVTSAHARLRYLDRPLATSSLPIESSGRTIGYVEINDTSSRLAGPIWLIVGPSLAALLLFVGLWGLQRKRSRQAQLQNDLVARRQSRDTYALDELQVLEVTWRRRLHNLEYDLNETARDAVYNSLIGPFKERILEHLKYSQQRFIGDYREAFCLEDAFQQLEAWLRRLAERNAHVHIEIRLPDEVRNAMVYGHAYHLADVVRELVRNSLDAVEQVFEETTDQTYQPCVRMTAEVDGARCISLYVENNGGHLRSEALNHIYRAPIARRRDPAEVGEGTQYITHCCKLMGIHVVAENCSVGGRDGFRTRLRIRGAPGA